jgi:hypothetical protein
MTTVFPREQLATEFAEHHKQINGLYYPKNDTVPSLSIEKLKSASRFITSQREVLSRLRNSPEPVGLDEDHPVFKILSFKTEENFRSRARDFRQTSAEIICLIRRINSLASVTHLPQDQFLQYQEQMMSGDKTKHLLRNWHVDAYRTLIFDNKEGYQPPECHIRERKSFRRVEIRPCTVLYGMGDLLTAFANYGHLARMVRGNLEHRVKNIKLDLEDRPSERLVANASSLAVLLNHGVPLLVEFTKSIAIARHAVSQNEPWKLRRDVH